MSIVTLKRQLSDHSKSLASHPVYHQVNHLDDFEIFMSHHVWAVWDFMSVLKSLQIKLTCVSTPWVPSQQPECAALINRIVVEEESDVDSKGEFKSHFEMYLEAMKDLGISTSRIECLINDLRNGIPWKVSLSNIGLSESVYRFVYFHLNLIETAPISSIAAVFALSREDLVPVMFEQILNNHPQLDQISPSLKYYLERHIELDGGEHTELAEKMLENLCGDDSSLWSQAFTHCAEAMKLRLELWDGISAELGALTKSSSIKKSLDCLFEPDLAD